MESLNDLIMDDLMIDDIDSILDKKIVKFDNRQQMSMYYIVHKSINALCEELSNSGICVVPKNIKKKVMLETAPSLIREYNGNVRKRCRPNLNNSAANATIPANNSGLVDNTICLARKIDGAQCTRKKNNNNDFCKNHINKLPNGRIDTALHISSSTNTPPIILKENDNTPKLQPEEQLEEQPREQPGEQPREQPREQSAVISKDKNNSIQLPITPLKRGRKSKIQFDPRQYDNDYITLWEDIVEGEKVLIDNANNIYTFDLEHPVYIGKKDVTKTLNVRQIMDSLAKAKTKE